MPRSQFGLQQCGTTAGEPNHKDGRGRARCWAGLNGDGFDGFKGAACFLDPKRAPAARWRWSMRPRAFMITRGVEDSSDAEPQTLLHDGLRGLIQSSLENVQGPLGLPRSVEPPPRRRRQTVHRAADRRGLPPTPPLRRVGRCVQGRKERRVGFECWMVRFGRDSVQPRITLVQTEFAQTACGFWATRHDLAVLASSGVPIRRVFPHERGSARPVEAAPDLRVVR